uniref:Cytochrome P450 716D58 n=1 Tax=Platycodon grandiflorus TaxID=94286 RepID=A0A1V1FP80_PLAGD|nr:cytochrome P450 716D58 [Platycodon grandiflorus]
MILMMMIVLLVLLIITTLISTTFYYYYYHVHHDEAKAAAKQASNLPPGSFGWPIIGETLGLLRAGWDGCPERFIRERVERHGSPLVFKTSLLGDKVAVLCGPAGNKFLFGNENKVVAMWWPKSVRKLFGSCLITSGGEEAKWLRKMLISYLGPVDSFYRHYNTTTMDLVTRHHLHSHWHGKKEVNVFQTIKLHTFELACRLFMSLEDPHQIEKLASLFNILLKGMIQIPFNFPGTRFYRAMRAVTCIRKQILIIVKQRRLALDRRTASSSQDLLSHLLVSSDENGRFLTQTEIVNNILTLLFAGHDTSSVTITLLMKTLAQLPQVYDQVLREQLDIAESKAPAGELLQWEDIQKMRYSWNVVSEVIRLTPPVIGAFREALVDFNYAGYTIPKGWKLYWSALPTQRDENFFPNATNFDPSRFEGGAGGLAPFSYVPFGGGPRMCLGKEFARLEILVFLHNVITRYNWDLLIPDEKIEYDPMPTPVKGLPVRLHPRQNSECQLSVK